MNALEIPSSYQPSALTDFAEIDRHFGRFIARFGGDDLVSLAARHLSRAVRLGHICLDLTVPPPDSEPGMPWPTIEEWQRELRFSSAIGYAGEGAQTAVKSRAKDLRDAKDENTEVPALAGFASLARDSFAEPGITPLVLDKAGRLYLRRYYDYEQMLAAAIRRRAVSSSRRATRQQDQEVAIQAALGQPLTVISGGPGTGKTTTVVSILARLLAHEPTARIALAAPTGKAAARLEQTVRDGFAKLPELATVQCSRILRASTLHRLLGVRPNKPTFRHNAANPLAVDVLVVDEASMVPLPLMTKLFDALPEKARVILLGDRDQLASVEPGSVLADIADAAQSPDQETGEGTGSSLLGGMLVMLRKNFRFGNDSAIFRLCEAVRMGDSQAALEIALNPNLPDLGSAPLPTAADMITHLRNPVMEGYAATLRETDPAKALASFSQFRILCAVRRGPYGVEQINRQIEVILREAKLIHGASRLHAGMPVLITQNDYELNLFNGDIGILLPDPNEPQNPTGEERPLWAWFPAEAATPGAVNESHPSLRRVAPARLPEHEPAYAMTVHKSQGSEFERVLLVLPDRDVPILTRELIYTGVTRARQRVDLWFSEAVFAQAVTRRTQRASGLGDALRQESGHLALF